MKFVSKIVLYSWKGYATAHILMMWKCVLLQGWEEAEWGARRAGKPARQQENPPCTVGLCSTFPHCAPRRQQKNPVCTVGLCSTVCNPGCTVGSLSPPCWLLRAVAPRITDWSLFICHRYGLVELFEIAKTTEHYSFMQNLMCFWRQTITVINLKFY